MIPPSFLRFSAAPLACLILAAVPIANASVAVGPELLTEDYIQSFDTLGRSSTFTWQNDLTLPGWHAVAGNGSLNANVQISSGSSNASDLTIYSIGQSGSSEDRALTYHTRSAATPTYLGLAFSNQTGAEIAGFTVGYTAEQWRENTDSRTLTYVVEYRIGGTPADLDDAEGWTPLEELTVDTNEGEAGRRTTLSSGLISDPIPSGAGFWIRWKLSNDSDSSTSSNDILAIDDVSVDFEASTDLAPSIVTQPLPQMVAVGDTATFSAEVDGVPAPTLAWFHGDTPISGESEATLVLEDVQMSQAGEYRIVATNEHGEASSNTVTLTVSATPLPPQILAQPENASGILGGEARFEVVATGSGSLSYRWFRDGSEIDGETGSGLTVGPLQATDAGNYSVRVRNAAGEVTSSSAELHVVLPPAFATQPQDRAAAEGGEVSFVSLATGEGEIGYQWSKDGTPLSGETSATLTLSPVTEESGGTYRVAATNAAGTVTSDAAVLTILQAPEITTAPAGIHLVAGADHAFTVSAAGSPPLSYRWTRNGEELTDATGATLSLSGITAADAGDYAVRVSNPVGETVSPAAALQVSASPVAPEISLQPVGFTAAADTSASLSVAATGTAPFTYSWTRNGSPLVADGPVLAFSPLSESDAGDYRVTVSNAAGSATSATVSVTVAESTQRDYFVAPDGLPDAAGTIGDPTTLETAIDLVQPGFEVRMLAGTYAFDHEIRIDRENSGTGEGMRKGIVAHTTPGGGSGEVVLDFSSQPYGKTSQVSNPRGIKIDGHWWHLRGLRIFRAADNGIFIGGNHNIVEQCVTHANRDTGIQISRYSSAADDKSEWPAHNLVLNCDSYDNNDHEPNDGENADGFAAKLTSGPGNVFRGCVGHNNIDDGWDLFAKSDTGPIFPVVIDQCVAYANGTLTDGTQNASGDRNGFKLGGSGIAVVHYVTRSIAFGNGKNGFTWNSNPAAMLIANNLAFDNERGNFKFDDPAPVFVNNVSLYTTGKWQNDRYGGNSGIATGPSNLFWFTGSSSRGPSINDLGLEVTPASFRSLVPPAGGFSRLPDGTLDLGDFGRPVEGSPLIDAGTLPPPEHWEELVYDVGSYHENAPDIGIVETYLDPRPEGGAALIGYALGYRDQERTRIDLPTFGIVDGQPTLEFKRLRPDVSYVVEVSDNLVDWDELAIDPGQVGEPVRVVDPDGGNEPRRFLRLRILLTQP